MSYSVQTILKHTFPCIHLMWHCSIDFLGEYRKDPKFSDRKVCANSADPDQTAPRGAV